MGRISIGTNKAVTISMKGARHGALVFQCLETFFYGSIACPRAVLDLTETGLVFR
jgi:hypothetical protein